MILALAYLAAGGIGALVGIVEIFQRYRAEPIQALRNPWGHFYIAFNAAMAAVAFAVACAYQSMGPDSSGLDLMQWAATAGFGSAVVLRAKLLDVQMTNGKEIALGPEIVVQTFLAVIDRELDRYRALRRMDTVRRLFLGIDFERSQMRLPMHVFQAMQGVSVEETEALMKGIAEANEMKTVSDQDKAYQLGYYLLDLVGEEFLSQILDRYRDDFAIQTSPAQTPPPQTTPPS